MKDTWGNRTVKEFSLTNPHLSHLAGKNMTELHKMFPDAKVCTSKTCEFNDIDHAIFMEAEQHDLDMQKKGMIKIMYEWINDDGSGKNKLFYWYDGNKWVKLTQ